jgi:hypothetical protein
MFCGLSGAQITQRIHALHFYQAGVKICSRQIFQGMFRDEGLFAS